MRTRKGYGGDIVKQNQLANIPPGRCFGYALMLCQLIITEQRTARAVTQIGHLTGIKSLHLLVVIHRVGPQIKQSVHLGAAALADKFGRKRYWQKEKAGVFGTWRAIIQHTIMPLPAQDDEFYQFSSSKKTIGNQSTILQILKNGKRLMLKSCTEPFRHLIDSAQPFTGIDDIADPINPFIRRAKICVAT